MLDRLEEIDQSLMLFLNGMHNATFDIIMHYTSEAMFWLPVYTVILFFVFKYYRLKGLSFFLIAVGLTVLLADRMSVELFKEVFQRYRPCHNEDIGESMHLFNDHCGGKYGFVSSHASNFFGLAVLFGLTLKDHVKRIMPLMILWATLIGYSRIYLGVHYPADVLGGAMLGSVIGIVVHRLLKIAIERFPNR